MSWLYSQALVEELSEGICSDGAVSVPSSETPMHGTYWSPDKTTEALHHSRSGMTFAPLTGTHGAALLTWYREVSLARTSARQGEGRALQASAPGSGRTWPASWAKYDPAMSSWKTARYSPRGGLTEFSGTWPRWGMMRAGECWALTTSEPPTEGSGYGLWPTPTASDAVKLCRPKTPSQRAMLRRDPRLEAGEKLNPEWVEWLMGWPLGWTGVPNIGGPRTPPTLG
jgi:hypothetical protein